MNHNENIKKAMKLVSDAGQKAFALPQTMAYYTLFNLAPSTRKERTGENFDIVRYPDGIQISKNEDDLIRAEKYPYSEDQIGSFWRPSNKLEWDIAVELLKEEVNNL